MTKLFSIGSTLFYFLSSNVWQFQIFHIRTNTRCFLGYYYCHPTKVSRCGFVLLHLCKWLLFLLTIFMSSLEKWLFKFFAYFVFWCWIARAFYICAIESPEWKTIYRYSLWFGESSIYCLDFPVFSEKIIHRALDCYWKNRMITAIKVLSKEKCP